MMPAQDVSCTLAGIVIKGPEDAAPRSVKLFANRAHMGFSDVQVGSETGSQEVDTHELRSMHLIHSVTASYVELAWQQPDKWPAADAFADAGHSHSMPRATLLT
jgi:hypothetical protein